MALSDPVLITRTKESNMPASVWGVKPERVMKVKLRSLSWEHRRPDQTFCDGSAVERVMLGPERW